MIRKLKQFLFKKKSYEKSDITPPNDVVDVRDEFLVKNRILRMDANRNDIFDRTRTCRHSPAVQGRGRYVIERHRCNARHAVIVVICNIHRTGQSLVAWNAGPQIHILRTDILYTDHIGIFPVQRKRQVADADYPVDVGIRLDTGTRPDRNIAHHDDAVGKIHRFDTDGHNGRAGTSHGGNDRRNDIRRDIHSTSGHRNYHDSYGRDINHSRQIGTYAALASAAETRQSKIKKTGNRDSISGFLFRTTSCYNSSSQRNSRFCHSF